MMKAFKQIAAMTSALALLFTTNTPLLPEHLTEQLPITASAANVVSSGECGAQGNNLTWTLDSEGTLTISGTGAMKNWAYGPSPWKSNYKVKNIVIENGVTTIGNGAFINCAYVTSVTIPDSVTSIGDYAFSDCNSLPAITLPAQVTRIGAKSFYSCNKLAAINIPAGVTSIGAYAFYGCSSLAAIAIPERVTSIGHGAFWDTPWLTAKRTESPFVAVNGILIDGRTCTGDIVIPDSVTSIGDGAFYHCSALTTVTIPAHVKHIGAEAFYWCDGLTAVSFETGLASIGTGAFRRCSALASLTIPDGVTGIGDSAFYDCAALTAVTLPESLVRIGFHAFDYCPSLAAIAISNPKCEIYNSAATISNTATLYGYANSTAQRYAEQYGRQFVRLDKKPEATVSANPASAITAVTPAQIVDSGTCGAYGSNLAWTLDSNGTLTISGTGEMEHGGGYDSPWSNHNIKKLVIENGVTSIGDLAFGDCDQLNVIIIENPNCEIYDQADTIPDTTTIYGFRDSTAEAYAIKYNKGFYALDPAPANKTGDVSGDGSVDAADAQLTLNAYVAAMAGLGSDLNSSQVNDADVNGDNSLSVDDAQSILLYYIRNTVSGIPTSWTELLK